MDKNKRDKIVLFFSTNFSFGHRILNFFQTLCHLLKICQLFEIVPKEKKHYRKYSDCSKDYRFFDCLFLKKKKG